MYALFKDGKQVGEARSEAIDAARDALEHGGMEASAPYGLGRHVRAHLAPGYEIREVAGTN